MRSTRSSIGFSSRLQWGRDVSIPEMARMRARCGRAPRLQWGRDVSIPEIPRITAAVERIGWLQWGRDVSIPEIIPGSARPRGSARASMGPGCFYPGNMAVPDGTVYSVSLQWDRDVSI